MTSKIKVDNIENQCGGAVVTKCGGTTTIAGTNVNATTVTATNVVGSTAVKSNAIQASDGGNLVSQCGTTITLGASGDTINLASGASQSGFGRTGTVDWQTTPKTATFTAANGEGYFINSGSAITANLPAGVAGAIVAFSDYARNFATYNLTISPNGSEKIGGVATGITLNVNGQALTLIYVDSTKGWVNVQNSENTEAGVIPAFITATGGTVTCCGNYKIHRFTGPGTFTVCSVGNAAGSDSVDYLVVAGGGSGGASNGGGGGGGAGGFRLSNSTCMPAPTTSPLANPTGIPVTAQGYPIVVGGGGSPVTGAGPSPAGLAGNNGNNSSGLGITSAGGGSGGGAAPTGTSQGGPGGSGGGEGAMNSGVTGGSGNTPPTSPPQGNPGGTTNPGLDSNQGSGGGGAGAAGDPNLSTSQAGPGGVGSFVSPSFATPGEGTPGPVGSTRYFAGGAGGNSEGEPLVKQGVGGAGGGTPGGVSGNPACNGLASTGGGGGGIDSSPAGQTSGAGGAGIVIIRYKFQ